MNKFALTLPQPFLSGRTHKRSRYIQNTPRSIPPTTLKPLPQLLHVPIRECRLAGPVPSNNDTCQAALLGGFLAGSIAASIGHDVFGKNIVFFWRDLQSAAILSDEVRESGGCDKLTDEKEKAERKERKKGKARLCRRLSIT